MPFPQYAPFKQFFAHLFPLTSFMKIGTKKVAMNSNYLYIHIYTESAPFAIPNTYRSIWCFLWIIHLVTIRITSSLRKRNGNNNLLRAFMSMVNYIVLSKFIHFELRVNIPCNIWELFHDLQTCLDNNKYDLRNFICLIITQNIMWHIF